MRKALQGLAASGHPFRVSLRATAQARSPYSCRKCVPLWAEYRGRGLHVAAVCPGPVETPFIDAMGAGVRSTTVFKMALPVDDVVRACLRALDGKRPTRIVGFINWLLAQTSRFSPRALTARVSAAMFAPPAGSVANAVSSQGDHR